MTKEKNQLTILLAENNPIFQSLVCEFLENEGYLVVTCADPYKARGILISQAVDLAILDVRLLNDNDSRDRTGLRIAQEIAHHVPKIILTGVDDSVDLVRDALKPGMNGTAPAVDYILKQDGLEALLTAVRQCLNAKSSVKTTPVTNLHAHKVLQTLLQCGPFESDAQLKAVFVDSRIYAWQSRLPVATSEWERVLKTIDYLQGKRDKSGDNALVLFLAVLCDLIPTETECHTLLAGLMTELKEGLK